MASVVRVPVSVLAAGRGVEIENGVYAMLSTKVNNPIKVLEACSLQDSGVHVIYSKINPRTN